MEQTARLHSSRASALWIQFSGWCPKLWGFVFLQACFVTPPVSGHSHPLNTSLGENYLFAPETASASSDACFPFHTEGKSHPKSFQPTKNTSFILQIHLLCISTHQRAENSPHDLGDMLFSAWPTALFLQLDGSLETRGILCCWRAKRRLLEQLTTFLFGTS